MATNAFATGRKPVYKLTTRLGRTVRATANHKFLAFNGWKRLDEINVGMHIAIPRTLPSSQSPTMTHEELALLGHLIGDGCTLPRHAVQYTTIDKDLADTVANLAIQVFGEDVRPHVKWESSKDRKGGWYQVYLSAGYHLTHGVHNPVAAWLDSMGIYGLRSYEKFVPSCVFAQPIEGIACFLQHLWSTDGHASCSPTTSRTIPRMFYATSSVRLAKDIQSLLLRLNINARMLSVSQGNKGRDQYHVTLSGKPDMEQFVFLIGIAGQRKQEMLEQVKAHISDRVANTNRDLIPSVVWRQYVVPTMAAIEMTTRQMQNGIGMSYCGTSLYKNAMGRERALCVATVVQSPQLALLAQSDVYWDEVVSVDADGESNVYDLTVDPTHNFIANDIILHNSIEQDADIVMFIYREDVYNPDTERKNIADIIVAKHRNGPVGEISLYFQASQTRFCDLEVTPPTDV